MPTTPNGVTMLYKLRRAPNRIGPFFALLLVPALHGCSWKSDQIYETRQDLKLVTVTRKADDARLYDGCIVVNAGGSLPTFRANVGAILTEHVKFIIVTKRTDVYKPALDDPTQVAYFVADALSRGHD